MASATLVKTLTASLPILSTGTPFISGAHIAGFSPGTPVLYGVNRPANSSLTKFRLFRQAISGNTAFDLGASVNAPGNTVGGVIPDASQLRVVGILNAIQAPVIKKRFRGDQVVPATGFIIAAGGGTAAADATLSIKGTTAGALLVGSTTLSIASSGADTNTILVGDVITVAGDTTTYYATATSTALNGTTEVLVSITPPLQVAKVAAQVVTVTAASGRVAIFADVPAIGTDISIWVNDAADIATVATFVASTHQDVISYDVMVGTSALDLFPLAKA